MDAQAKATLDTLVNSQATIVARLDLLMTAQIDIQSRLVLLQEKVIQDSAPPSQTVASDRVFTDCGVPEPQC